MTSSILGCVSRDRASRSRGGILSHFSALVEHTFNFYMEFYFPAQEKRQKSGASSAKGLQAIWGLGHLPVEEMLKELASFKLEKRDLVGSPPVLMRILAKRWSQALCNSSWKKNETMSVN